MAVSGLPAQKRPFGSIATFFYSHWMRPDKFAMTPFLLEFGTAVEHMGFTESPLAPERVREWTRSIGGTGHLIRVRLLVRRGPDGHAILMLTTTLHDESTNALMGARKTASEEGSNLITAAQDHVREYWSYAKDIGSYCQICKRLIPMDTPQMGKKICKAHSR
jgi:hypothetical protein